MTIIKSLYNTKAAQGSGGGRVKVLVKKLIPTKGHFSTPDINIYNSVYNIYICIYVYV